MHKRIIKTLILFTFTLSLIGCNGFFDKDNTPPPSPLPRFAAEINPRLLWSARAGTGVDEYLKESPSIDGVSIFVASLRGLVTSVNKVTGHVQWKVDTCLPITSGTGAGEGVVVVGSRKGDVAALRQTDGSTIWKVNVRGEVLARPVIENGIVIIKTVNGFVRGLSTQTGQELWWFQQQEPNLILRGSSSPVIRDGNIIIGFASGNLMKVSLADGQQIWQQQIAEPEGAFAIQRMIDIDADPIVFRHQIYAATYQGKIASLDWGSGNIRWSQDISSYTGMAANDDAVFISDARSYIWAFNADSGFVLWRQCNLAFRGVTGPAVTGNYIVVGDSEGYLHWLDQRDGHFAARVKLVASIYATPIAVDHVIYALTSTGYLTAYTY